MSGSHRSRCATVRPVWAGGIQAGQRSEGFSCSLLRRVGGNEQIDRKRNRSNRIHTNINELAVLQVADVGDSLQTWRLANAVNMM
jgi:hypothetical protein